MPLIIYRDLFRWNHSSWSMMWTKMEECQKMSWFWEWKKKRYLYSSWYKMKGLIRITHRKYYLPPNLRSCVFDRFVHNVGVFQLLTIMYHDLQHSASNYFFYGITAFCKSVLSTFSKMMIKWRLKVPFTRIINPSWKNVSALIYHRVVFSDH